MGRRVKENSISKLFAKNIIYFCISFISTFILLEILFFTLINLGIIHQANYSEKAIENQIEKIKDSDISSFSNLNFKDASYILYDDNFNILLKNTTNEKALKLKEIAKKEETSKGSFYYMYIQRDDETYCVFEYRLNATFSNKILNKVFPNAEFVQYALILFLFILYIILFSKKVSKEISKEMDKLKETMIKINSKNLDFDVKYSNISEINGVIKSLEMMKNELKASLKREWDSKEEKRRQLGALIHDLKTPLTVIRGNAELMAEEDLNEDQKDFNESILSEALNMEKYIKILMDIINSERKIKYKKEKINIDDFFKKVTEESLSVCRAKNIEFISSINYLADKKIIKADEEMIKRAVFNVISNAVSYTQMNGKIIFSLYIYDEFVDFIVEDSGKGFLKEDLKNAKTEFYTKDKSRHGFHYGMGLYIADIICKKHGGCVKLSNSTNLKGAKVILKFKNS
ncbi:HAMP domain-containing sensor histidine kinase [Clostridium sp. BJN0001]|uniref:HAMP domain-containing sensor histidine kinase n=1 Tax=Clostridium sp. BJN0001 TaxID=2930219 RepID=UPI001FD0FC07|nr:HAMP domain-containing sensor histidine kinase [Clostridium sp. BJN0001]